MKQTDPQMKIRLPPDLKARVEEAAAGNGRSMNAEIVARLEASFEDKAVTLSQEEAEQILRALAHSVLTMTKGERDQFETATQLAEKTKASQIAKLPTAADAPVEETEAMRTELERLRKEASDLEERMRAAGPAASRPASSPGKPGTIRKVRGIMKPGLE